MKISVLCENASFDIGFLAEWGFSLFIEFEGMRIIFDTGYSDVYLKNAKTLRIDVNDTDFLVLSHYHNDHTGGLEHSPFKDKKKLVCHPRIKNEVDLSAFELIESRKPVEFAPNVFFLGEIPRKTSFEAAIYNGDEMLDDTAIAFKTDKGCVVISGCSHSGIANICEYAKKITGQELYAVLGGFHLIEENMNAIDDTIAWFKKENPPYLYPTHCVHISAFAKFYNSKLNVHKIAAGEVLKT